VSAYTVRIVGERDYATLCWLSDHGYDAGFLELATLERVETPDGTEIDDDGSDTVRVYGLSEPEAWNFKDEYDADPCAFLACCGSSTLTEALVRLLDCIV